MMRNYLMLLRYIAPLGFFTVLIFTVVSSRLLGQFSSSPFLWWVNQELYSRLRQILYIFDSAPVAVGLIALASIAGIGLLYLFKRVETAVFIVNHMALLTLVLTQIADAKASYSTSLLGAASGGYLSIIGRFDSYAAFGCIILMLSSLACHRAYLNEALRSRTPSSSDAVG